MKIQHLTASILLLFIATMSSAIATDDAPSTGADSAKFLANYTNPEQVKVPVDGMYPFGQRMWLSGYSNNKAELIRMKNAGFTMTGPHYNGCSEYDSPPNIVETDSYGMKTFWRLYISGGTWNKLLNMMKTADGRASIRSQVERCINAVLSDPVRNRTVVAWYGVEEPMNRGGQPIAAQREYMKLVRDVIAGKDPKRRPLFASERTDSSATNMVRNAKYTSGIMKQNYLIRKNGYDYSGHEMNERFLIGQWVRDQFKAAKGSSYTGKIKPVIATLSMYVDPDDSTLRNEPWLRKALTHDVYLSFAMGVHGINFFTWVTKKAYSTKTKNLQENLYIELIGKFTRAGLPDVFLWGDERHDIEIEITSGPKTFKWNKYSNVFTEPSIKFRNIQYGDNRYILLVNSSKNVVRPKLSGFPSGLHFLDIIQNTWYSPGTTITPTIHPLGVRIYKIAEHHPSSIKPYSRSPM